MFKAKIITVSILVCIISAGFLKTPIFGALKFSDVPDNAYYATSVYTLVNMGAISGYGDGRFGPK